MFCRCYVFFCFVRKEESKSRLLFCFAESIIRLRLLSFLRIRFPFLIPRCGRSPRLHKHHPSQNASFLRSKGTKKDALSRHPCFLFMKLWRSRPAQTVIKPCPNVQASSAKRSLFHSSHAALNLLSHAAFHSSMTSFSGNMAIMAFTASRAWAQLQNSGTSLTIPISIPSPVTTSSCESIHFSVPST